jgi:hypothetical protein
LIPLVGGAYVTDVTTSSAKLTFNTKKVGKLRFLVTNYKIKNVKHSDFDYQFDNQSAAIHHAQEELWKNEGIQRKRMVGFQYQLTANKNFSLILNETIAKLVS